MCLSAGFFSSLILTRTRAPIYSSNHLLLILIPTPLLSPSLYLYYSHPDTTVTSGQVWDRRTGAFLADYSNGHEGRIFGLAMDCTKVRLIIFFTALFTFFCSGLFSATLP